MARLNQTDLLLIGKTGNGKSATGNSILRRKAFHSQASTTAITSEIQCEVSEFNGRIIKVVDGPGVGDNRINTEGAVNLAMTAMEHAIAANPRGYNAFLFVVRFGGRFTAEDQDTIDFLKKIFGQDFVNNFCVLVLTCGDNFEKQSLETDKSFKQWCNEETGRLKDLLKECKNRVVLFDNVTKDQEKKNKQIENLLSVVDHLSSGGQRYCKANFERARETRARIIVELKKSIIEEETMQERKMILMKITQQLAKEDSKSKIESLEKLQIRVESLLESLSSRDRETGVLSDLMSYVKLVKRKVSDEIKLCFRRMEEREKVRRREEEIRRQHQYEMRFLKELQVQKVKEDTQFLELNRRFEKEQEMMIQEMFECIQTDRKYLENIFQEIFGEK